MQILLPPLAFAGLFLVLKSLEPVKDWRACILRTGLVFGVYATLVLEILSLFQGITRADLAIAWLIPLLGSIGYLVYRYLKGFRFQSLRWTLTGDWFAILLRAVILIILLLTALVAWKTPPQTYDSLNYHMSRVAHWAQQQAVRHYPTGIEVQNNMPPGAEFLFLHSYVLSQGDRWVNFIQWFAMLGSLIGVSYIAQQLGADKKGQLLSAGFAATIPMGIVQASSTMTDYVLAFWMLCVASETIRMYQGKVDFNGTVYISFAAGLAILTKPTSYAFLMPFALWVLWILIRNRNWRRGILYILLAMIIVSLIPLGHFTRNQLLYGNPIGPTDRFDQHANQLLDHRGLISNLVRNISLHIRTPSPYVNKGFAVMIQGLHQLIGLDVNDPRTTAWGKFKISTPSTHEILTGNPLHALLIMGTIVALIWRRRHFPPVLLLYASAVLLSYLFFSYLYKWLIFGSRLQLPFFLLYASVAGFLIAKLLRGRLGECISVVLFLGSIPWLFSIETRPIIPNLERSPVESVLTESRLDLLFSNSTYLIEPARDVVIRIKEAGCTQVGLMLKGNGVEYPFWYMLNAPRQDLRMEWIVADTYSASLSDPNFEPCAVICEDCKLESQTFRGLPASFERAPYRLYLSEENE
jgi:hypothetical protein